MEQATFNQLSNLKNSYQNLKNYKPVLCVCSAGMLRSATMAVVLANEFKCNTRAAGTEDYALVPVSQALLCWAEEIVCAEISHKNRILEALKTDLSCNESSNLYQDVEKKIKVLNIPDQFEYRDGELIKLIIENYKNASA